MMNGIHRGAMIIGLIALTGLIAAPAGAVDCNQAGNSLSNCDFTTDLTDWWLTHGDTFLHQPADGATAAGCIEVDGQYDGANYHVHIAQGCFSVTAGETYDMGFSVKIASGQTSCYARANYYTDTSCSFFLAYEFDTLLVVDSTWQETLESHVAPATAESVQFNILCSSPSDYEVRLDDAVYGQNIVPVELMSFSVE